MKKIFALLALCSTAHLSADYPANNEIVDNQTFEERSGTYGSATDQKIMKDVKDTLNQGRFQKAFQNVNNDAADGIVVLTGSVQSQNDKKKAEDIARKVQGVKSIRNLITVKKNNTKKGS